MAAKSGCFQVSANAAKEMGKSANIRNVDNIPKKSNFGKRCPDMLTNQTQRCVIGST